MFYGRGPGFDFEIYVNEGYHVVRGIDPFDVWSGKIESKGYYPYGREDLRTEDRDKRIDGNVPWAYAYFLPFSGDWSTWRKWQVWVGLEILSFLVLLLFSSEKGIKPSNSLGGGGICSYCGFVCWHDIDGKFWFWKLYLDGFSRIGGHDVLS